MNDERQIINEILEGNVDAFEKIVEIYEHQLYVYVYRLCFNEAVAEEILQNAFLKAFKYLNTLDVEKGLKNWLYTICRNCYFDYINKEKKIKLVSMEDVSFFLASIGSDTENSAISRDELSNVIKEIYALPVKYSEILLLRYVEDKSYEEIAEILGIPVGTVKIRIHRARQKLRENVYPDGEDFEV